MDTHTHNWTHTLTNGHPHPQLDTHTHNWKHTLPIGHTYSQMDISISTNEQVCPKCTLYAYIHTYCLYTLASQCINPRALSSRLSQGLHRYIIYTWGNLCVRVCCVCVGEPGRDKECVRVWQGHIDDGAQMVYGLVVTTLPIPNTPVYISCTSYKCTCIGGCILLYI